ncbi:MAG: chitinase [Lachnospiraceae bacterium]|nr:chitinase [Lachnospiraceae bacterium]
MKKKKQSFIPVAVALVLIAIVAIFSFFGGFFGEITETSKEADLNAVFGITESTDAAIIYDHTLLSEKGLFVNDTFYIPLSMANNMADIFYYDPNEKRFFATTGNSVHEASPSEYAVKGEDLFVSVSLLKNYASFGLETAVSPARISIQTQWGEKKSASISKKTPLHIREDRKSDSVKMLEEGDIVRIISSNDIWSYCGTDDLLFGFIENKKLAGHKTEAETPVTGPAELVYPSVKMDGNVVLGWHNVTNDTANSMVGDVLSKVHGMNVISPTWFALKGNDGSISSIADASYVETVHAQGIKVWGLADNFTNDTDTDAVLSHTTSRRNLESNLINAALTYGLDGINIDFEQLPTQTSDDFCQFLRELSILCHANNLVLSSDNYVPKEYTNYYRRDIQGRVCDYVIIMGYDEHTSSSDEPGSVASIGFVTEGIENTLKDVPAEKVINGIPFYTRLYSLDNGILDCSVLGMADAATKLSDSGVTPSWDNTTCQNVAIYEKNGAQYSIWLEDAQSISAKLSVMRNNNLAGVACWRLMLETEDIWDVISAYYPTGTAAPEADAASSAGAGAT